LFPFFAAPADVVDAGLPYGTINVLVRAVFPRRSHGGGGGGGGGRLLLLLSLLQLHPQLVADVAHSSARHPEAACAQLALARVALIVNLLGAKLAVALVLAQAAACNSGRIRSGESA